MHASPPPSLLPHAVPANPYQRLLLFAVRRMAAAGISDAQAAHAIFTGFGLGYRRPLVLLRAFMAEVSRVSSVTLKIAPCCCVRMTDDEARLLAIVSDASSCPRDTHDMLAEFLRVRSCPGAASSAEAVYIAFMELGMPLSA